MRYVVHLTPAAERDLKHVPEPDRERIAKWLRRLESNPRPHGIVPIKSQPRGNYRGRVGHYRVGFEVHDSLLEVCVWEIARRDRFYGEANRRR